MFRGSDENKVRIYEKKARRDATHPRWKFKGIIITYFSVKVGAEGAAPLNILRYLRLFLLK